MYGDAGFDLLGADADYPPRSSSFCPYAPKMYRFMSSMGEQVALIASRLREMQSPYAGLVEMLGSLAFRRKAI